MTLTLPLVTVTALADSTNPCAISVLLLTMGFLVSLRKTSRQIITTAGLYIFGIFMTYVFIGLGILRALTIFGIPQAISKFGALIIILVGLLSLGEQLIPKFPVHLAIPNFIKPEIASLMTRGTYFALFAMGVVVGLFEFPCTGGPYLTILTLLHDRSTMLEGALYLIYYNLLFVSPLVFILVVGSHPRVYGRVTSWRKLHSKSMDIIASLVMIALGGVILSL